MLYINKPAICNSLLLIYFISLRKRSSREPRSINMACLTDIDVCKGPGVNNLVERPKIKKLLKATTTTTKSRIIQFSRTKTDFDFV